MSELRRAAQEQILTEMLKSQFIIGFPEPYRTRLYENPLLIFEQCQTKKTAANIRSPTAL